MNSLYSIPHFFDCALFASSSQSSITEERLIKQIEHLKAFEEQLTTPMIGLRPTAKEKERYLEVALGLREVFLQYAKTPSHYHRFHLTINFYANRIQHLLWTEKRKAHQTVLEMTAAIGRVKGVQRALQATFEKNFEVIDAHEQACKSNRTAVEAEKAKTAELPGQIQKIREEIRYQFLNIERLEIIDNVLTDIEQHFPPEEMANCLQEVILNPETYMQASWLPSVCSLPFPKRAGVVAWPRKQFPTQIEVKDYLRLLYNTNNQTAHLVYRHAENAKKFVLSIKQEGAFYHLEFQLHFSKQKGGTYFIGNRPHNIPSSIAKIRIQVLQLQRQLQQLIKQEQECRIKVQKLEKVYEHGLKHFEEFYQSNIPSKFSGVKSKNPVYMCMREGAVLKAEDPLLDTRALEVASWLMASTAVVPSITMPAQNAIVRHKDSDYRIVRALVQPLINRKVDARCFEHFSYLSFNVSIADTQKKAIVQALLAAKDLHRGNLFLVPEPSSVFLHAETGNWEYQASDNKWKKVKHFYDLTLHAYKTPECLIRSDLYPGKEVRMEEYPELLKALSVPWKFECFDNEYTLGGGNTAANGKLNHLIKWGGKITLPVRSFFLRLQLSHRPLEASVKEWIFQLKQKRASIEASAYSGHHILWRLFSQSTKELLWAHFKSATFVFPKREQTNFSKNLPESILNAVVADLKRNKITEKERVQQLLDKYLLPLMPPQQAAALMERIDAATAYVERSGTAAAEKPATVYGLYASCFPCFEPVVDLITKMHLRTNYLSYVLLSATSLEAIQGELQARAEASSKSAAAEPVTALSANFAALSLSPQATPAERVLTEVERCIQSLVCVQKKHAAFFNVANFPYDQWGPVQAEAIEHFYKDVIAYIEQGFNSVDNMTAIDYTSVWRAAAQLGMKRAREKRDQKIGRAEHAAWFQTAKENIEKLADQVKPELLAGLETLLGRATINRYFNRAIEFLKEKQAEQKTLILQERVLFYKKDSYSDVPVDRMLAKAVEYELIDRESATYEMLQAAIQAAS